MSCNLSSNVLFNKRILNLKFASESSGGYVDSAHSFSLKNRGRLEPFQLHPRITEKAIYDSSSYGPTFGSGFDLCTVSSAGSSTSSYANLGHAYVQLAGRLQLRFG